jgi:hypothetical protein
MMMQNWNDIWIEWCQTNLEKGNYRQAVTQVTTNRNVQIPTGQTRRRANLMNLYPQEHAHVWHRQHRLNGYSHPLNLPNGAPRAWPANIKRAAGMLGMVCSTVTLLGLRMACPYFSKLVQSVEGHIVS